MARPVPLPTVGFQSDGSNHCYFELIIMAGRCTVQNSLSSPDAPQSQWADGKDREIAKGQAGGERAAGSKPQRDGHQAPEHQRTLLSFQHLLRVQQQDHMPAELQLRASRGNLATRNSLLHQDSQAQLLPPPGVRGVRCGVGSFRP